MPTDLEIAFTAIRNKRPRYDLLWKYYDGFHPVIYAASRLNEIFKNLDAVMSENWCAVVVDSVLDRIHIDSFTATGKKANRTRLARLWQDTGLILDSYDAHLCALVTGEAAILVGLDEDGQVEAYYNDSRLIHVEYEPARPRVMRFAAKLWQDEAGEAWHLTLYYPDRFEYYVAHKKEMPDSGRAFVLEDSAANEWGVIPLFHLTRTRRALSSELQNIINPQNQVNKLLADMMVAAEFGAFRQRYIISNASSDAPLKNQPGLVWDIPANDGTGEPTKVGELGATELTNYIGALDRQVNVIAAISHTPKHYFFVSGAPPSGESLKTMESPLTKKVTRYEERFEPTWRAVAAFMLRLDGTATLQPNDIDVIWTEPATDTPLTESQVAQTYVGAGMPLVTVLRRQGWSDTELEQMQQDWNNEMQAQSDADTVAADVVQRVVDQVRGNGAGLTNA